MRLGNRVKVSPILHVRFTKRLKEPVTCLVELTSQWQVSLSSAMHAVSAACGHPSSVTVPEDVAPSQEPLPCGQEQKVPSGLVTQRSDCEAPSLRGFPSPEEESYFQTSICFVFNVQKGCRFSGTLFLSSRLYRSLLHKWGFYCWPLWSCQLGERT